MNNHTNRQTDVNQDVNPEMNRDTRDQKGKDVFAPQGKPSASSAEKGSFGSMNQSKGSKLPSSSAMRGKDSAEGEEDSEESSEGRADAEQSPSHSTTRSEDEVQLPRNAPNKQADIYASEGGQSDSDKRRSA